MLQFQSARNDNRTPVSSISLCSGKSGIPYVDGKSETVAYPNSYNTNGTVGKVTVISGNNGLFLVEVVSRISRDSHRVVFSKVMETQELLAHVFQDLETGHHRLYSAESVAKRSKDAHMQTTDSKGIVVHPGNPGLVAFDDGLSMLLSALEWLTGEDCASRFAPVSRNVGCSSNMPTLEKVVFGQASRHVRVRRPSGSKSFSSGMPTTEMGGAKLPSAAEKIRRLRGSAERNLEIAEQAFEAGKLEEAEVAFSNAADFEQRAAVTQGVINDRMSLLRERAAAKRAERKAVKEADESAA